MTRPRRRSAPSDRSQPPSRESAERAAYLDVVTQSKRFAVRNRHNDVYRLILIIDPGRTGATCGRSQAEIAAEAGWSLRKTRSVIGDAVEARWLEVHDRRQTRWSHDRYQVRWEAIVAEGNSLDGGGRNVPAGGKNGPPAGKSCRRHSKEFICEDEDELRPHEDSDSVPRWGKHWVDDDLRNPAELEWAYQNAVANGVVQETDRDRLGVYAAARRALGDKRERRITNAPGAFRRSVETRFWADRKTSSLITRDIEEDARRLMLEADRLGRERERRESGAPTAPVALALKSPEDFDPDAEAARRRREEIAKAEELVRRQAAQRESPPGIGRPGGLTLTTFPEGNAPPLSAGRLLRTTPLAEGMP